MYFAICVSFSISVCSVTFVVCFFVTVIIDNNDTNIDGNKIYLNNINNGNNNNNHYNNNNGTYLL